MIHTCPGCGGAVQSRPSGHGIVYACANCKGRSMGLTVLRNAGADRELLKQLWLDAQKPDIPRVRNCPTCGRTMALAHVSVGTETIPLDVCRLCQSVWFDPSEYEAIPKSLPPPKDDSLHRQIAASQARNEVLHGEGRATYEPDHAWQWILGVLGMPIECDKPERKTMPFVTWALALLCAFTLVLTLTDLETAVREWGFIPAKWARHGGLTLIASFFLHGGILHFSGNVYFLLVFGDNVEERMGPGRYVLLVLGAHLAGVALHAALGPNSTLPLVGASGGISGIIAYYAIVYPRVRIGFLFWWYRFFSKWMLLPAWGALVLFAILQILGSALQIQGFSRVSYLGHLGGLAVGAAVGALTYRVKSSGTPHPLREHKEAFDEKRDAREHSYQK